MLRIILFIILSVTAFLSSKLPHNLTDDAEVEEVKLSSNNSSQKQSEIENGQTCNQKLLHHV